MTSLPASRSARAMTFAPRSCPSSPGFATRTRIFLSVIERAGAGGRRYTFPRANAYMEGGPAPDRRRGRFLRLDDVAKLDLARAARTGLPEIVLAEGKLDAHLVDVTRAFVETTGRALVWRLAPERARLVAGLSPQSRYSAEAGFLALGAPAPRTGGRVLVLAAGTA